MTFLTHISVLAIPRCPAVRGRKLGREKQRGMTRKPSGNTSGVRFALICLVLFHHPSERRGFKTFVYVAIKSTIHWEKVYHIYYPPLALLRSLSPRKEKKNVVGALMHIEEAVYLIARIKREKSFFFSPFKLYSALSARICTCTYVYFFIGVLVNYSCVQYIL